MILDENGHPMRHVCEHCRQRDAVDNALLYGQRVCSTCLSEAILQKTITTTTPRRVGQEVPA